MGKEIERKFKVLDKSFMESNPGMLYRQGYLNSAPQRVVRVRVVGDSGYLTVKGTTRGMERSEYEYEIPFADAQEMLDSLCEKPIIEKHRYKVEYEGFTWEVDEFHGENDGLVIAEIELKHEEEEFLKPSWVGDEVTGDERYYNSNLIMHPYKNW